MKNQVDKHCTFYCSISLHVREVWGRKKNHWKDWKIRFFKITEDQKKDTAFLQVNQFNWQVKALSCKRDLSFVRSSPIKLKITRLKFGVARNVKLHWFQFLKEVTLYSVETHKRSDCVWCGSHLFFFFIARYWNFVVT